MEVFQHRCWLGHGSYGDVQLCEVSAQTAAMLLGGSPDTGPDKSAGPTLIALKTWKQAHKDGKVMRIALREVQILKDVSHPNIIRLQCAFRTPSGRVCMAFEYGGKSTHQLLESRFPAGIPRPLLQRLVLQLAHALRYLHSHKIIHRDVKPANVLVDAAGVLRLCDFGFARYTAEAAAARGGGGGDDGGTDGGGGAAGGGPLTPYVITRWYRSPEVLLGMPYGTPTDVWSLGCTLAELGTGEPLLPGDSSLDQLCRIAHLSGPLPTHMAARAVAAAVRHGDGSSGGMQAPPPPLATEPLTAAPGAALRAALASRLDPDLFDLVAACLRPDPRDRPTMDELLGMPYCADAVRLFDGTSLGRLYGKEGGWAAGWDGSALPAAAVSPPLTAAATRTPAPPPGARGVQSARAPHRYHQAGGGAQEPLQAPLATACPYHHQHRRFQRPQHHSHIPTQCSQQQLHHQQHHHHQQQQQQQQQPSFCEPRVCDIFRSGGGCGGPPLYGASNSSASSAGDVAVSIGGGGTVSASCCSLLSASGAATATTATTINRSASSAMTASRSISSAVTDSLYGSGGGVAAAALTCSCCCVSADAVLHCHGGGVAAAVGPAGDSDADSDGCGAADLRLVPGAVAASSPASQAAAAAAAVRAGPSRNCGGGGAAAAAEACWHGTVVTACRRGAAGAGGTALPAVAPAEARQLCASPPALLPVTSTASAMYGVDGLNGAPSWPAPAHPSGFSREAAIRALAAAAAFAAGEAAAGAATDATRATDPMAVAAAAAKRDALTAALQPSSASGACGTTVGSPQCEGSLQSAAAVPPPPSLPQHLVSEGGGGAPPAPANARIVPCTESDRRSIGFNEVSGGVGGNAGGLNGGSSSNSNSSSRGSSRDIGDGDREGGNISTSAAAPTAARAVTAAAGNTSDPWVARAPQHPWRTAVRRNAGNSDDDGRPLPGGGDAGAAKLSSSAPPSGPPPPPTMTSSARWLDSFYHQYSPPVTSSAAAAGVTPAAAAAAARLTSTTGTTMTTMSFNWHNAESPGADSGGDGEGADGAGAAAVEEEPTLRRLTADGTAWTLHPPPQQPPQQLQQPDEQPELDLRQQPLRPEQQPQQEELQQEEQEQQPEEQEEEMTLEEESQEAAPGGAMALVSAGLWPPGANAMFPPAANAAREGSRRRARASALQHGADAATHADVDGVGGDGEDEGAGPDSESGAESEGCRPCDLTWTRSALCKGYASAPGCGVGVGVRSSIGGGAAGAAATAATPVSAAVARGPAAPTAPAGQRRQPLRSVFPYYGVSASCSACAPPSAGKMGSGTTGGVEALGNVAQGCGTAEATRPHVSAVGPTPVAAAVTATAAAAAGGGWASLTSSLAPSSRPTSCRTSIGSRGDGSRGEGYVDGGVAPGSSSRCVRRRGVRGWLRKSRTWLKQMFEGGSSVSASGSASQRQV